MHKIVKEGFYLRIDNIFVQEHGGYADDVINEAR